MKNRKEAVTKVIASYYYTSINDLMGLKKSGLTRVCQNLVRTFDYHAVFDPMIHLSMTFVTASYLFMMMNYLLLEGFFHYFHFGLLMVDFLPESLLLDYQMEPEFQK